MKMKTLIPLLALLVPVLKAETLVVLSGNSIQEKIDAASDGDIIAIFGGSYNQNIIVNKKVRLAEVAGQDVYITGSVTFTDLEETPPFQGFRVGAINIRGTKGLVIKDVDCEGALTLWGNGVPDVSVVGGSQGSITQRAGSLVVNSASIQQNIAQMAGSLTVNSSSIAQNFEVSGESEKTIAFRTTVNEICSWGGDSAELWFGYSEAQFFRYSGTECKLVMVGSKITSSRRREVLFNLEGNNNKLVITNSLFNTKDDGVCLYARGLNHKIEIRNNHFLKQGGRWVQCIDADTSFDSLKVIGNIFSSAWGGLINAGFGAEFYGNHSYGRSGDVVGGVVQVDSSTTGDPLFVDGDYYSLGNGSPCVDAGPNDPRFNDRDGSRNDIGPSGGSWYDPEGWTTEKPVVISFDLLPDSVLEGVDTEVTIEEVRAVSGQ